MLKQFLFVTFLSITIAACQQANNVVIDDSPLINTQLTYFDKDSIDIAPYIGTKTLPTISDSFQVEMSSSDTSVAGQFGHLTVMVQNDSGNVLTQVSFPQPSGNLIGGELSFSTTSVYVGNLTYTFTAYNNAGAPGSYTTKVVHMYNSKVEPPVIDTVIVPDSVQVNSTDPIFFDVYTKVHDPSGLSDISGVYFKTTNPDGSPAIGGTPLLMYDDGGASGAPGDDDKTANDGTFTLNIELSPLSANPPPQLGDYTFTFYAINRSGITSDSISHKITVYK
ncbi:MAG: hypothetical protein ACLP05_09005 [Candidatus Kryptoniota bacterium]